MGEVVLTICICAYNMQDYLRRALESCKIRDLKNIEVLIMDDGSTDSTGAIADEYACKYPETFKHIKKPNGGWGSNLNMAVSIANGKYFKELDADDWFDTNNLNVLVDYLSETNEDLIITNHLYCYPDHTKENTPEWKRYAEGKYNMADISPFYFPIWDAAYKTEVIRKEYISLPEHAQYTDNLFVLYALEKVQTVSFHNYVIYNYVLGRDDQSVNINSLAKHYSEMFEVVRLSNSFYKEHPNNKHILYKVKVNYYSTLAYIFQLYLSNFDEKSKLKEWIKKTDKAIKNELPELYKETWDNKKLCILRLSHYKLIGLSALIELRKHNGDK